MDAASMVKAKLPAEITSYDLLKAAAVIIMIIDHVGYYFFIDEMWWRAVGRIGSGLALATAMAKNSFPAGRTGCSGVVAAASAVDGRSQPHKRRRHHCPRHLPALSR